MDQPTLFDHGHGIDRTDARESGKKPKDRWFDPWLCAKGEALKDLVASFHKGAEAYEKAAKARKRARRPDDAETHKAVVEVIVTNLALACLDPPANAARIAVPLRKGTQRNRYENPELSTRILSTLIKQFDDAQVLALVLGKPGEITTTIFPTEWFARRVSERAVTLGDFGRRDSEEVIILKRKAKGEDQGWTYEAGASYEDYEDTDATTRLRAEVRTLNRFLESSDMSFVDDGVMPVVNTNDRRLRRHFTTFQGGEKTFDRTGRLFGGWWLHLAKDRRANIRLQGHPIAILDYASMFGRLAYSHLGSQPPEGDLYDLSGLLSGYDSSVKDHRDGVKKVFNAMMFRGAKGKLPKGAKALLPKRVKVDEVRQAIIAQNPDLAPLFDTQVGYKLMFEESCVLLKVLSILMRESIVALPLHDGIMVAKPHAEAAMEAMKCGVKEITGFVFPVDLKA